MQPWYVYLLRCTDNSLYCGITTDIDKRLDAHNSGTASKYTRSRRPVILAAITEVADKSTALKLEIEVKKLPKDKKISRIQSNIPVSAL
ncbi:MULTISPECIES: GIY-YIG nuclease family protein [unclassified Pseudodesulfovibrio]|uniref:GIY-YIG nuclease family protein n=1 Tax=unclassified Pseudodesulfovibrio TaxID=2661612 RepID=UPI000FEB890B|nr:MULTISPECIES: GIY-YIG nuclease family protein [unclassified Pseudodesulfovibrio]MCJ2164080.1 GIY-YIG nuclease family protein [Pseudodesulfovibrio sp. S3-i]RWU05289.1 GIY-YIG nuclease family protein [Pseudodesulfovibrio sp. S3]